MDAGEDLVVFNGAKKSFGPKRVLDGFSLEVRRGETMALLGRSGTGKSVTLKLLLGLLRPDAGRISFAGHDLTEMSERELSRVRQRMGMVFQGAALFDSLTVAENVAYALRERRVPGDQIRERVAECLRMVDLPGTEELLPEQLSGGMRKRVAIARAIATSPELMLYDEPTTGLDPATAHQAIDLIRSLQRRLGVTSIVVTHDMDACFQVADRIALLALGRIVWLGGAEEAQDAPPPELVHFLDLASDERGEEKGDGWHPPAASP
jgi:phospholipid/cholesterol/gamma-HCH transport system ATP-binding protein